MNALWAIIQDTWRQSRQQVLFMIMLGLLALITVVTIAVPKPFDQPDGSTRIGFIFTDEPSPLLEESWAAIYAQTLMVKGDDPVNPFDFDNLEAQQDRMDAAMETARVEADTPMDQRAVEVILNGAAGGVFTFSMLLFLAASAGYFPAMLEAGAIDIVLAKPVDRLRVFLGKYLGGLALYSAAVAATYFLMFVGIGLRTGVWHGRLFLVMPLQIFTAAVLFAIIAALGIVSRNATLSLVVGLIFYLVVDSVIGTLIQMQQFQVFESWPWVDTAVSAMRNTLPNFGLLKQNATASVLNIPLMEWQPFLVALAWLGIALAFGYWRFRKADY